MSAEHKRPLLACVLVAIACMLILANALRAEALRGYLKDGAHRLATGLELALDHPSPPQPVVAPPAAAPFDRLGATLSPGRPSPGPARAAVRHTVHRTTHRALRPRVAAGRAWGRSVHPGHAAHDGDGRHARHRTARGAPHQGTSHGHSGERHGHSGKPRGHGGRR